MIMEQDNERRAEEGRKEMFYLWIYDVRHMIKTTLVAREETRCRHMGYSLRLAAMVLLYAPSKRLDNTYHGFCYISRGTLVGTGNIDRLLVVRLNYVYKNKITKEETEEEEKKEDPPPSLYQLWDICNIALITVDMTLSQSI